MIEQYALPEFFTGKNKSKTPEIYLAYQNFMIDTHHLNPQEHLTVLEELDWRCVYCDEGSCLLREVGGGLLITQWIQKVTPWQWDVLPTPHFSVPTHTPSGLVPLHLQSPQVLRRTRKNQLICRTVVSILTFTHAGREWTEQETSYP